MMAAKVAAESVATSQQVAAAVDLRSGLQLEAALPVRPLHSLSMDLSAMVSFVVVEVEVLEEMKSKSTS